MEEKRWQDGLIIYCGIYLLFSPLVLRFYSEIPVRSFNFYLMGIVAIALAASAIRQRTLWQELANAALGAWMIISPWIVGYSRNMDARNTALSVGALIVLVSLWGYYSDRARIIARERYGSRAEAERV